MSKVSVLVPSRNERFLPQTIADVLRNATGEIEVIAVLDGYDAPLPDDPRLIVLRRPVSLGMRAAINSAAAIARGKYLLKCDAHCAFQEGFDEVLKADCDDNWIVIPRRDRLDAENWTLQQTGKPPVDLHYLSCPITNRDGYSMHGVIWPERDKILLHESLSDTMSFQGSCWFMSRRHFDWLGGMSEVGYGTFCQEPQEIGNKTWLGGGRVVVNKRTTYLHLHKGKQYGRGYHQDRGEIIRGHTWAGHYWMNNQWPAHIHDIEWLVDKFAPVPTWPEHWEMLRDHARDTARALQPAR